MILLKIDKPTQMPRQKYVCVLKISMMTVSNSCAKLAPINVEVARTPLRATTATQAIIDTLLARLAFVIMVTLMMVRIQPVERATILA